MGSSVKKKTMVLEARSQGLVNEGHVAYLAEDISEKFNYAPKKGAPAVKGYVDYNIVANWGLFVLFLFP
jgi:hypothetical protein